ncbi:MAG: ribonuclease HII, partial [Bacillota bacterium]|nr:ribonuclease HII [Bacillota bacterium]
VEHEFFNHNNKFAVLELPEAILTQMRNDQRASVLKLYERVEKLRSSLLKEQQRLEHIFRYEKKYWQQGCPVVVGVDEAGRGPLAGPVVAAVVIFSKAEIIFGLNDSKKVSESNRYKLENEIKEKAVEWQLGIVDNDIIDSINIRNATFLAMQRAIEKLTIKPDMILVDGFEISNLKYNQLAIVKGDQHSASIAAASILAKCTRDRLMVEYDDEYPQYSFAVHKGYGTRLHYEQLTKHGASPIHRKTFLE